MTTLDDFIASLKKLQKQGHGNLPVAIADWGEHYNFPSFSQPKYIKIGEAGEVDGPGVYPHYRLAVIIGED